MPFSVSTSSAEAEAAETEPEAEANISASLAADVSRMVEYWASDTMENGVESFRGSVTSATGASGRILST